MNILNTSALRFFRKKANFLYNQVLKDNFLNLQRKKKIHRLLKGKPGKKLTKNQTNEIKNFYQELGIKNISNQWHQFYTNSNGNFSAKYVPENLFYIKIEPALNATLFYPALADKNLIGKMFPKIKQPETVIKNSNGCYLHNNQLITFERAVEICSIDTRMIIKPTIDSWGGKNILLFSGKNDASLNKSIAELLQSYNKNFIVQKVVEQHVKMRELNSTSLNTFRVMTLLRNAEVVIISTIVRIGRKGAFTDNATTGGIPCGVQMDGKLNPVGYDLSGKSYTKTDGGIEFKDIQLPFMDKIRNIVRDLHTCMPYFRIISWDLAVDAQGDILLIEHNDMGQDINFHQLNNGPVLVPVLKEYQRILNI